MQKECLSGLFLDIQKYPLIFGMRVHPITKVYKLHTGTDVGAPMGATFVAMADGTVINASYNSAYGNMVMIDHR